MNWEVLTEFNENGEPNFYDSSSSTLQSSTGNAVKDLIIKKCKDSWNRRRNQKKPNFLLLAYLLTSQPKKKFASLFCTLCSEDDFDYNLHAAGSLHVTQTDINTDHNHELTYLRCRGREPRLNLCSQEAQFNSCWTVTNKWDTRKGQYNTFYRKVSKKFTWIAYKNYW